MSPNDADGMANSVDPDQTAPAGAVLSGSALFAQAYLSENSITITVLWLVYLKHNFHCLISHRKRLLLPLIRTSILFSLNPVVL